MPDLTQKRAVMQPFLTQRLGIVMRAEPDNPYEAWGVLNPGGVRGPDGAYYLFPRLVAEGNFSRIGRCEVMFDTLGEPIGVQRLGFALEPSEPYEVTPAGGGVEDPRVTYVQPLDLYVMAYTAYTLNFTRVALAVSRDLVQWRRLGPLYFDVESGGPDLNTLPNKDAALFPEAVPGPDGRPALAILHRPSLATASTGRPGSLPDGVGPEVHPESIWMSYVPLDRAAADILQLVRVSGHRHVMSPRAPWEAIKIGAGPPPVRLPYGWLLIYHGVGQLPQGYRQYSAGAAILALDDPTTVLYRSPDPILAPEIPEESVGIVPFVVFPTATDRRGANRLDVYYGAADETIGAVRLDIPATLPMADLPEAVPDRVGGDGQLYAGGLTPIAPGESGPGPRTRADDTAGKDAPGERKESGHAGA